MANGQTGGTPELLSQTTMVTMYSPEPLLDQRHRVNKNFYRVSLLDKIRFFTKKSLTGGSQIVFGPPNFQEGYKIKVFIYATRGATHHILAFGDGKEYSDSDGRGPGLASMVCQTAWADGNLPELARQLDKMVEHPDQSQPNPGLRPPESPCTILV